MKIIGLTGPSGAGKSTLCAQFESYGIPCINTDDIYHKLTSHSSPCTLELKEKFGDVIVNEDGSLNRHALAEIVFKSENSKEYIASLNATTHKYIWEETNKLLTKYIEEGKRAAVIDAPVLFSSKIFIGACDMIVSVLCDRATRLDRIVKRDSITNEQALDRMNAQPSDEFFIENSDYYITNNGSLNDMNSQLVTILAQEGIYVK